MKPQKSFLICSLFIFSFSLSHGQGWNWVKTGPPMDLFNYDHLVTADNMGNAYVVGTYGTISVTKFDNKGNLLWTKPATQSGTVVACSIAVYSGGVYIVGYFNGQIIFGNDTLSWLPLIACSMFIIKFDTAGNVLWDKNSTGTGRYTEDYATSVSVDDSGNAYMTGVFGDTITFEHDTIRSSKSTQMFLAKFFPNGNIAWIKIPQSGSNYNSGSSVTTDKTGNIYVTGLYSDILILGKDTLTGTVNGLMFVARFNSAGNPIWLNGVTGGTGICHGNSIAANDSNSIYVAGDFSNGSIKLGSGTFVPTYSLAPAALLAKFNSLGHVSWVKQDITLDSNKWSAVSICADRSKFGYVLIDAVSGYPDLFEMQMGSDTFQFNATLHGTNVADAIIKFDSAGNILCGSTFSEGGEDDGDGIGSSPSGNYIYIAGDINEEGIFGTDTINPGIGEPLFLASWQPCYSNPEEVSEITPIKSSISLFPNPNNGKFTIKSLTENGRSLVEVYDILGSRIYASTVSIENSVVSFDLSDKPAGIYLYRVITATGTVIGSGKFVIER